MNFSPKKIYYEKDIINYALGKELLEKFQNSEWIEIDSHNNIEELRKMPNSEFANMKRLLIIGTRKTHRYVPNEKVSNYLVPWTSSGCSAACLYCYLVCNYNKCSYLRLFVNREKMMERLLKNAKKSPNSVFEIGSNSDLILENQITRNLVWTIEKFAECDSGKITFPTKFDMVDDLLSLNHRGRVIARMSINPEYIINRIELGTSNLIGRINAINKLYDAGYEIGILIAPVVLVDNWKNKYLEMLDQLKDLLSTGVIHKAFFEVIFMTYSFVHRAINTEAFPNAIRLYSKELMTGRGRGKYCYKKPLREEGAEFFQHEISKRFGNNKVIYIV